MALKILPAGLVRNPDRVRRFTQEAKSASALSHPHIVTLYEIGEAPLERPTFGPAEEATETGEPAHFIAMERIDGHTLKTKIHREWAASKDLLRWLSQAAEGLAKAHAEGIVHQDLKPDNIMVTNDGHAKVLDFGLAKLTEPLGKGTRAPTVIADQTAEGAVLGTVGYMSTEQVQGKRGQPYRLLRAGRWRGRSLAGHAAVGRAVSGHIPSRRLAVPPAIDRA